MDDGGDVTSLSYPRNNSYLNKSPKYYRILSITFLGSRRNMLINKAMLFTINKKPMLVLTI